MGKLFNLSFIVLILLCSCNHLVLSIDMEEKMEEEDNNLCIMQGVQYKYEDTREVYWKCRLRVMDQRIADETNDYGYNLLYQRDLKRIKASIKNRIQQERKKNIKKVDSNLEEKEHNYCIMLEEQNDSRINGFDYLKCRENIANILYKNKNNLNQSNEDIMKMLGYKINKTQIKSIVTNIDSKCVKYATDIAKLNKCQNTLQDVYQCEKDADEKIKQRQIDDRIYCIEFSIDKYPDSLSSFNDNDSNNDNTNKINIVIGPKMEKINIINLREKEYKQCINDRNTKLNEYSSYLTFQCNKKIEQL
jgi:hypothetical protein